MDLHKKNKHNKSDKNGVAKRDLKIMQLEEEMKKKKAFLLKKRKELDKNKQLNEYLEIAKEYSTPKSSIFINGILDNLVKEFQTNKKMIKAGRGLM